MDFAGFVEAFDDEVFAKRLVGVHHGCALHHAIQNDGDAAPAVGHRGGKRDHFVGARTVEGDINGILATGRRVCPDDVRTAQRDALVQKDRSFDLDPFLVLVLVGVRLVARNNLGAILDPLGQRFAIGPHFVGPFADLAEFELGDFFEDGADGLGFFGFHAGHLDQDCVGALDGDETFLAAERVEAVLDHFLRLFRLLDGDRHGVAQFVNLGLDFQGE